MKDARIDLRASAAQVDVIDRAAEAVQKSRSAFVMDSAMRDAESILAERRVPLLDNAQRDEFLALLDRPPAIKPRLLTAIERYSESLHE
jgi:uncharacterized protein (DUF1778 family)